MSIESKTMENEKEKVIDNLEEDQTLSALKAQMRSKKEVKKEEFVRSLKFGLVGLGQAGGRLVSALASYGYNAICFNTATQDLKEIQLPDSNKYLLKHGALEGAAKELSIGYAAAEANTDGIINLIQDKLSDTEVFVVAFSLGGGSGAGSAPVIIDLLSRTGRPIVVIAALPMTTEDAQTKQNALETLSKLSVYAQEKTISNLIVVDNAKLETIYSDVSHMNFFKVANQATVSTLDAFNKYSKMSSNDKPLDSMEWAKILTDGEGLSIYGEIEVDDYTDDVTAIAKAVMNNNEAGLLASGFDLSQAKYSGVIIVANSNAWSKITRSAIDYAAALVAESCPGAEASFRGSYVDDSISDDIVKIYSMFSGLGLPDNRVQQLKKDVDVEKAKVQERGKARTLNLTLDTGKEKTVSKADEIRQKIAKSDSKFMSNFTGKLDFRK
jgi:cell division GTPase FtsZ